jgi:hypothetical protein
MTGGALQLSLRFLKPTRGILSCKARWWIENLSVSIYNFKGEEENDRRNGNKNSYLDSRDRISAV